MKPNFCRATFFRSMFFLLAFAAAATVLVAQQSDSRTGFDNNSDDPSLTLRLGIGKRFKVGRLAFAELHWNPLPGKRGIPEIVCPDSDGAQAIYRPMGNEPMDLSQKLSVRCGSIVRVPPRSSNLIARLVSESGETLLERRYALGELGAPSASSSDWWLSVGPNPGLSAAVKQISREQKRDIAYQEIDRLDELPLDAIEMDSIDVICVSTSDIDRFSISSGRHDALMKWTSRGGRLLILSGKNGESVFGPGAPWEKLAPGTIQSPFPLRRTSGLETYTGIPLRLGQLDQSPNASSFSNATGLAELYEGSGARDDRMLLIRSPYGFGETITISLDLDQPPFDTWEGTARVYAKLLSVSRSSTGRINLASRAKRTQQLGYTDLAGQLRFALDHYPQVGFFSFTLVGALTTVFILLVGPADYFLSRLFGVQRSHITWVIMPLMIGAFLFGTARLRSQFRTDTAQSCQLEIVDYDAKSGVTRGHNFASIYSPTSARFGVTLENQVADGFTMGPSRVSWFGSPGTGLSGLDSAGQAGPVVSEYEITNIAKSSDLENTVVQRAPIPSESSKAFVAEWEGAWVKPPVTSELIVDRNGALRGFLGNQTGFDWADYYIIHQEAIYVPRGKLERGLNVRLEQLQRRDLEAHLTKRRVLESDDASAGWDPGSNDVARIADLMLFHGAARGESFTGLSHRYFGRLDLSDRLRQNNAILVIANAPSVGAITAVSEKGNPEAAQSWRYWRLILPVQSER